MSSSIHLQYVVVQFSLGRLSEQLTGHQRMGDVIADGHPSVVFEQFRGISYKARYSCFAKKLITPE